MFKRGLLFPIVILMSLPVVLAADLESTFIEFINVIFGTGEFNSAIIKFFLFLFLFVIIFVLAGRIAGLGRWVSVVVALFFSLISARFIPEFWDAFPLKQELVFFTIIVIVLIIPYALARVIFANSPKAKWFFYIFFLLAISYFFSSWTGYASIRNPTLYEATYFVKIWFWWVVIGAIAVALIIMSWKYQSGRVTPATPHSPLPSPASPPSPPKPPKRGLFRRGISGVGRGASKWGWGKARRLEKEKKELLDKIQDLKIEVENTRNERLKEKREKELKKKLDELDEEYS